MIKIMFDASMNFDTNTIGIGLYEIDSNKTTYMTITANKDVEINCSYSAEKIAMRKAMQWAKEEFPNKPYKLFTDNLSLFRQMHSNNSNIFWIPRELNKEADRMSKIGSSVIQKTKEIKFRNESDIETNIKDVLVKIPRLKKIALLTNMAKSKGEKYIISKLKTNDIGETLENGDYSEDFLMFAKSILSKKERSGDFLRYMNCHISNKSDQRRMMKNTELEGFIRERINL